MPFLSLTSKNEKEVKDALDKLSEEIPPSINKQMGIVVKLLQKALEYTGSKPPTRPGQKYVRTYNMMNKYSTGATESGHYFKADAAYSGYVLGDAEGNRQAWMHVGRWKPTAREILENILEKLPENAVKAIKIIAPDLVKEKK